MKLLVSRRNDWMFKEMRNAPKSPIKEDRVENVWDFVSRLVTNVAIAVYG